MKRWWIALAFLTCATAASAATPNPCAPSASPAKPASFEAWLAASPALQAATVGICLGRHCMDDDDCACTAAQGALCAAGSCVYSYPGTGGGSPQSGALCLPGRHCNDSSDCTFCDFGATGFCAGDGVCRVV
jgi:hypothetical protein